MPVDCKMTKPESCAMNGPSTKGVTCTTLSPKEPHLGKCWVVGKLFESVSANFLQTQADLFFSLPHSINNGFLNISSYSRFNQIFVFFFDLLFNLVNMESFSLFNNFFNNTNSNNYHFNIFYTKNNVSRHSSEPICHRYSNPTTHPKSTIFEPYSK